MLSHTLRGFAIGANAAWILDDLANRQTFQLFIHMALAGVLLAAVAMEWAIDHR